MITSYDVILNFNDGSNDYNFPYLQELTDNKEKSKHTILKGKRGDGVIFIPGARESQKIEIKGILIADNYSDLTTLMDTMRSSVSTDEGILTLSNKLKHSSDNYSIDWAVACRRISEIEFADPMKNFRINYVEYRMSFIVLNYYVELFDVEIDPIWDVEGNVIVVLDS